MAREKQSSSVSPSTTLGNGWRPGIAVKSPPSAGVETPEERSARRRQRIAEQAYHRAMERGFVNGDPVEDWLMAECEIDAQDQNPNPSQS